MIEQQQVNMNRQGLLAKLLAKENLRIQHGNYQTAFFDTKHRVLGLPIWKDTTKDVYDLLVGHEVGHALYTPLAGIEEFRKQLPEVPFSLCNIVEDIRVERMIQETYPGLGTIFRQAYKSLVDRNFFGTSGKDLSEFGFADRLNIHAKCGSSLGVPLSPEELAIHARCLKAQTFEDVIQICRDIAHLVRKQKQDQQDQQDQQEKVKASAQDTSEAQQDPSNTSDESEGEASGSEDGGASDSDDSSSDDTKGDEQDGDGQDTGESSEPADSSTEDAGETKDDSEAADADDSESSSEAKDRTSSSGNQSSNQSKPSPLSFEEELTSQTDKAFSENLQQIVETPEFNTYYFMQPSRQAVDMTLIGYRSVMADRSSRRLTYDTYMKHPDVKANLDRVRKSATKYAANLAREFEMRKSAFQYSRATQSVTGTLNMSRLHAYKHTEDIFKSVTRLANAKDHGMMLFVDYSSSMQSVIGDVLEHTVNLVMFCRMVGIPFQVLGFTNPHQANAAPLPQAESELSLSSLQLIEIFSSEMTKPEFDTAIEQVIAQAYCYSNAGRHVMSKIGLSYYSRCPVASKYESLSGTPLNEAVVAAHEMVARFRRSNPIQKMNVVFLTDGDGSCIRTRAHEGTTAAGHIKGTLNGRALDMNLRGVNSNRMQYMALIQNLQVTTGSTVMALFIPSTPNMAKRQILEVIQDTREHKDRSSQAFKPKAARSVTSTNTPVMNVVETFVKAYHHDGCTVIPGGHGFDAYCILPNSRELHIDEDQDFADADIKGLDPAMDGRKLQRKLATAFTNYNESNRSKRIILTKFAQLIS